MAPSKPSAVKKMAGNAGRRQNKHEPRPRDEPPDPPKHLNAYAREEWKRKVNDLHSCGILTVVDDSIFAAYCQCQAQWRAATEKMEEHAASEDGKEGLGFMFKTSNGNWIQHPLLSAANSARRDMIRYAAQLGLTPSSRSGIHVPPRAQSSKASKYGI